MSETTSPASKPTHWRRAIRPLIWWLIMVLLMFAYRTHQRLSATTILTFETALVGKPVTYDATVSIDNLTVMSGQRIPIGWHTLTVLHRKAKPYSTNLFVWYGKNALGQITLERAMGTLVVNANPRPERLVIHGPEFSVRLTNTTGFTSSVPTDTYVVEAGYNYWRGLEQMTVNAGQTAVRSFAPKMGVLRATTSHPDVIYKLITPERQFMDAGHLPVTITDLPEGKYHLISTRKDDERGILVEIQHGLTNEAKVEFLYGAALIESDPPGASVLDDGRALGVTPLALSELKPGRREFTLRRTDYEPAMVSLTVVAKETNVFRTNLVSRFYTQAMAQARRFFDDKDFKLAADMSSEALKHKPDDGEALRLNRQAKGLGHVSRAEVLGKQGDYPAAIQAANAAIESLEESEERVYANRLLADLTKREQENLEAEKKRQAELAEQKRKQDEAAEAANRRQQNINRLGTRFYELNRTYNNASSFLRHELIATNRVGSAATQINTALIGGQPAFEIVKYEWPQKDTFVIQARHKIGLGYRECLIIGAQVDADVMHILYKVFEYENPPDLKLLGGFLTATSSIKITSQDPAVEQKKAERFQTRIKEGVELVKGRIESVIKTP